MTTYHITAPDWSATLRPDGDWRPLRELLEQLGCRIVPMLKHDTIEIAYGDDIFVITYEGNRILHTVRWSTGQPPENVSLIDLPDEVRDSVFSLLSNGGL